MLTSLALIFLLGLLLGAFFKKIKLPGLIGMLITGIILGPYVLNLLDSSILLISADLREIALIIILARAGLSLNISELKKVGRSAFLLCFIPACFEMVGTILIAPHLLGITMIEAAILGAVIASASPAVIVPRMLHLMEKKYGTDKQIPQMILSGDSIDDIFNIVVFTAFLKLGNGEAISVFSFIGIPISIILGIAIGVGVGITLSFIFKRIKMRNTVKTIVLLSTAFLLIFIEDGIANHIPFSGLLAVMASGITIFKATPDIAGCISNKLSKLWVGAEILLFVLVGASVNIHAATSAGVKTIILLLAILTIRAIGILICVLKTNLNKKERLFCALTGIPKATVQAAIGGIPLAMGLACGEIVLAIAVITILVTAPIGAFLIDISHKKLLSRSKIITLEGELNI